jgi:hypothetical protein
MLFQCRAIVDSRKLIVNTRRGNSRKYPRDQIPDSEETAKSPLGLSAFCETLPIEGDFAAAQRCQSMLQALHCRHDRKSFRQRQSLRD